MINTKHLRKVVFAWTSIVYTICYVGVAIYPPVRDLFMQYALHTKTSFMSMYFNFGYFISGLIIWNIVTMLGVGLFALLYNKIKE